MNRQKNLKSQQGFSFIEALASVFVFTVGIAAVFSLMQNTLSYNLVNSYRLTAAYLAQEGIEITRNLRDDNWLAARTNPGISWDTGLNAGDYEADYLSSSLSTTTDNYLKFGNGYYNYSTGTNTIFKRKITIFDKTDTTIPPDGKMDMLKVSVLLTWQLKGKSYSLQAQENLYNWE